jgi:biopolymer transport protein ExbD
MSDEHNPPAAEEAVVTFERKAVGDDEVDMTPMIDCVFLLLIFFLVTASFQLQKALEVPAPEKKEKDVATKTLEQIEDDEDYIIVRIDKDNTIWVNDSEAPSEQDLLVKLREAHQAIGSKGFPPNKLLVIADGDCRHDVVIRVLDAGNDVGIEKVQLTTSDDSE